MVLRERFVRRAISKYLERKGWAHAPWEKETIEHGPDTVVRNSKYARYFIIETKVESRSKSARSQRETGFICALGQIVTRKKPASPAYRIQRLDSRDQCLHNEIALAESEAETDEIDGYPLDELRESIPLKYKITSYGADFDVKGLVRRISSGENSRREVRV